MAEGTVAIIDDDPVVRAVMRVWLEREGYRVREHAEGREAIECAEPADVVSLDLGLDDMPGMHVLTHLIARDPELPIVVVTAENRIETAVEAMRAGAYDFLTKPFDFERFVHTVGRAVERRRLLMRVRGLERALGEQKARGAIVGASAPMRELAAHIHRLQGSDIAVAIFGESGTGKELVARAIHENGRRADGPFVAVNCAAIPQSLEESELFGHEKGAFTGAIGQHRGRFEQASGGTLFLDEIGEMSAGMQAALLRTLQERTIRRVGGTSDVPIDVRVMCATHRDLEEDVRRGRFREDLYYRIVVYPVRVPPLRKRIEDLPLLLRHFIELLGPDTGRTPSHIDPHALEALVLHDWPGNVRELGNVVHRALVACDGDRIELAHLPPSIRARVLPEMPRAETAVEVPLMPLRELERRAIRRALHETDGNMARAARLLGIGRATLYRRLAEAS
jgi:DNA-binding NtrC family response regulator